MLESIIVRTLSPGTTLGDLKLVRELRGGTGRQIFAASDFFQNRACILKVAALDSPANAARLEREFAVLREAAGLGVVAALGYAVDLPKGLAWLTLAAHGPSLAAVLAAVPEQHPPASLALAAMYAAAESLGDLHDRGWMHGDLKPGNLLCGTDGSVVLSDLEFAQRPVVRPFDPAATPRAVNGTPAFMAPELWQQGAAAQSLAADVWALGVTLYLCLFRDYPFGQEGDQAIVAAIARGLPPQIAELPEPLQRLLAALLASEPQDRPQNGRAAAAMILSTAHLLDIDLSVSRQALGQFVAKVPEEELPAEPGTWCPPPDSVLAAPLQPQPAAPQPPGSAVPAPRPDLPPGVGAGSDFERRSYRDFLDMASRFGGPPAPAPISHMKPPSTRKVSPLPSTTVAVSASASLTPADARVTRRAAARWYRRMNPDRSFPLSVVFSGKQIRIVGGSGLGIILGQQEIVLDASDPVLSVEPMFPGCIVSPPQANVHVAEEQTVCRFWITPLVCDELAEACVTIRYRGKVVETLATPAVVVDRAWARLLAAMGVVTPVASKAADLAGWNPDDLLRQSLPQLANLIAAIGVLGFGLGLAGILLAASLIYFYITRPLLSDEPEPALVPQAT
jgi:serine/threonine-protein kinase